MDPDENRHSNVDYLIEAANILPFGNYAHKLLKSYYLTKCKKLAQSDLIQSNTLLGDEEMCRKCSTPRADVNYSLSIAPIKVTKRKAAKLHKQIEHRSRQKSNLAKKLSKRMNNIMTVRCDLCNCRNNVILYKKPAIDTKSLERQETVIKKSKPIETVNLTPEVPSKKKKKKKDKNAGLLYSLKKDDTNTTKKIVNLCQQTQTLNIQKNQFNKNSNPKANKNKTNASKGPKQKSKNISQPAPKRNNLLLLAKALKSKDSQSNSSADKLKQMLR